MPNQERWLLLLLVVVILVPIWAFMYFPSQDGPIHLYNAHVLRNYSEPDNSYARYYKINSPLTPNVLADFILSVLLRVMAPLLAEKVLLSLYVLLLIGSSVYFANAVNPKEGFAMLGAIYAYNLFVLFGFYNFAVSIPLFLLTLGLWLRYRDHVTLFQFLCLTLLVSLVYLSHLFAWTMLVFCLIVLSFILDWGRSLIKTLGAILPSAAALFFIVFGTNREAFGYTAVFSKLTTALKMLALPVFFRYFSNIEIVLAASVTLFLVGALVFLPRPYRAGPWTAPHKAILFLAGLLIVGFLVCPYYYGPAGYNNIRVLIFAFVLLTPLVSIKFGTLVRTVAVGYVLVFSVAQSMHVARIAAIYNAGYYEYASSIDKLKTNSVILAIVKDRHGPSKWVAPYSHFYYHYHLAKNGINPYHQDGNIPADELEAIEKLSIVQLRQEYQSLRRVDFSRPLSEQLDSLIGYDYILVWDKTAEPEMLADFSLIHRSPHLLIYEHRPPDPVPRPSELQAQAVP